MGDSEWIRTKAAWERWERCGRNIGGRRRVWWPWQRKGMKTKSSGTKRNKEEFERDGKDVF